MDYYLFLDDQRIPRDCRYYVGDDETDYDTKTWKIVRSFQSFVDTINEQGIPKKISFDYDLGPGSDGDGLDCAKFLKHECLKRNIPIPEYQIHSLWPGIRQKFYEILG